MDDDKLLPHQRAAMDQLIAHVRDEYPNEPLAFVKGWIAGWLDTIGARDGDAARSPSPKLDRMTAKTPAASDPRVDRPREEYCVKDHRTWASLARCLWPRHRVVGDGPWALVTAAEVRLYGPDTPVVVDSRAVSVVRLEKGPHRRGEGWTP